MVCNVVSDLKNNERLVNLKMRGFRLGTFTMNRPPPYFPQSQLSPPDEKRYKKFKLIVGAAIFFITLLVIGAGIGIFYLVRWMI